MSRRIVALGAPGRSACSPYTTTVAYGDFAIPVKIIREMASGPRTAMKVTTVRFGADLWRLLEAEAAHAGISVSQYIREAALARAAAAAAARGHAPFDLLAGALREVRRDEADPTARAEVERVLSRLARLAAAETRSDSHAVVAESKQAQTRHEKVRQASVTSLRGRAETPARSRRT